ncbi:MAG: sigma-54 dependent transcriptional regulator [Gammaproteobacteria bacterium]|nr:sigma-54 dependent transcriptional regulator [Gammaproteobacteria bacterium]
MATGNDCRAKVLVLDTDRDRATNISRRLRFLEYQPIIVVVDQLDPDPIGTADDDIAAVICAGCKNDALHAVATRLRDRHPGLPFLCLSNDSQFANGPNWCLESPLKRSQLERLLSRARRYHGTERRHRITGTSHPIRRVRRLIEQVADFDTNVLVTGQSGTGKELVARTIHELSNRCEQPFVPINCGAIPADLLESELFGHQKGAFTGAVTSRQGRFELAEGGTLFLDEIGEMSLDMQVKLLRVLQERTFERVGNNHLQKCNVRIIAATHVDIPEAVRNREFREDLFYRLNVFPIDMPPLYQRVSDLPQLLDELFISQTGSEAGSLRVSPAVTIALASYRWPGNIRELSNLVERLAILKPSGTIEIADLPTKYRQTDGAPIVEINNVTEAMQMTEANLKEHLQTIEQQLIGQAMAASDGVVAKAARLLSMRRTTLVEKISKYHIA